MQKGINSFVTASLIDPEAHTRLQYATLGSANFSRYSAFLQISPKCSPQMQEGANSFVTASLFDPEAHTRQQYDTGVVLNESGPRYDFKVDFVNIAGGCRCGVLL